MIIPNPVLKIVYHPGKDVLFVEWPEFSEETLRKAEFILTTVLDTINTYKVKNLLSDNRKGKIEIPPQIYKDIAHRFAVELENSSLKKIARIIIEDNLRAQSVKEVSQRANLTLLIKSFYTVKDGFDWLTSDKPNEN